MFLRYRATRRKFKRLVSENQKLRGEVEVLKAERDKLQAEVITIHSERFEREMRLLDRVLTSKGSYAVTDEVRSVVEPEEKKHKEELSYFLEKRRKELEEDAKEAGRSIFEAEQLFHQQEEYFIQEFESN